jgi:hypothetical protein
MRDVSIFLQFCTYSAQVGQDLTLEQRGQRYAQTTLSPVFVSPGNVGPLVWQLTNLEHSRKYSF